MKKLPLSRRPQTPTPNAPWPSVHRLRRRRAGIRCPHPFSRVSILAIAAGLAITVAAIVGLRGNQIVLASQDTRPEPQQSAVVAYLNAGDQVETGYGEPTSHEPVMATIAPALAAADAEARPAQSVLLLEARGPSAAQEPTPPDAPAQSTRALTDVNITFYDCLSQGFCGAMYNGVRVYEGAAACSWDLPLGTNFRIRGDPTGRTYRCDDRGILNDTWVDIFWNNPDHGWAWQQAVGRVGTIEIVN